jgi:hypothetical protein
MSSITAGSLLRSFSNYVYEIQFCVVPYKILNSCTTYKSNNILQIPDYSGHQHAAVEVVKSSSLPPDCAAPRGLAVSDGHSTDTSSASERLFGAPSEGNAPGPTQEPCIVLILTLSMVLWSLSNEILWPHSVESSYFRSIQQN